MRGQLGVQIQKIRLSPKIADIVITAAAGNAAHRNLFMPGGALQNLVQRAIPATGVDACLFPILGTGGRNLAGVPGPAGDHDGGG